MDQFKADNQENLHPRLKESIQDAVGRETKFLTEHCHYLESSKDALKNETSKTAKQLADSMAIEGCLKKQLEELRTEVARLKKDLPVRVYIDRLDALKQEVRDLVEKLEISNACHISVCNDNSLLEKKNIKLVSDLKRMPQDKQL